jgi:hypothetical protein
MAIDSAASLLFNIGADSGDAEANVQRFRALLGKDLDDLSGEFSDWSMKVFGDLTTVEGAMLGVTAALGAGIVALGVVVGEATEKYAKYVEEVEHGSRVTGIGMEQMSGLHLAAQLTSTNFDTLTRGIAFFENQVHKANQGSAEQLKLFGELHISQTQLAAGEKDIVPLIDLVTERFHNLGSSAERVAIARGLFSRSGVEDQKALDLMAMGIRNLVERAREMGIALSDDDGKALEKYRVGVVLAKAELQALAITIGREVLPMIADFAAVTIGVLKELSSGQLLHDMVAGQVIAGIGTYSAIAKTQVEALAASLTKLGGKDLDDPVKKTKENFSGLRDLLMEVLEREQAITGGEEGKITVEIEKLQEELAKATAEYNKLYDTAEKRASENAKVQAAAMRALPQAIAQLQDELRGQLAAKNLAAQEKAGEELQELVLRQGEQTLAVKGS